MAVYDCGDDGGLHGEDRRSLHTAAVHRPHGHPCWSSPWSTASAPRPWQAIRQASRIESLSIVPMLAMGNAMSTFTAQNIGAGKLDRVKEGYKMCYVTVLTVGAVPVHACTSCSGGAFVSLFLGERRQRLPILWAFQLREISFLFLCRSSALRPLPMVCSGELGMWRHLRRPIW